MMGLFFFFFFPGVFSCFSTEKNYSVFSFCLTSSVFMKLGETVTTGNLEIVYRFGSVPVQFVWVQWLSGKS